MESKIKILTVRMLLLAYTINDLVGRRGQSMYRYWITVTEPEFNRGRQLSTCSLKLRNSQFEHFQSLNAIEVTDVTTSGRVSR